MFDVGCNKGYDSAIMFEAFGAGVRQQKALLKRVVALELCVVAVLAEQLQHLTCLQFAMTFRSAGTRPLDSIKLPSTEQHVSSLHVV
jgi:hypothetical protein